MWHGSGRPGNVALDEAALTMLEMNKTMIRSEARMVQVEWYLAKQIVVFVDSLKHDPDIAPQGLALSQELGLTCKRLWLCWGLCSCTQDLHQIGNIQFTLGSWQMPLDNTAAQVCM